MEEHCNRVHARLFAGILKSSINLNARKPSHDGRVTIPQLNASIKRVRSTDHYYSGQVKIWSDGEHVPRPTMARDLGHAGSEVGLSHWSALNFLYACGYLADLVLLRSMSIIANPPASTEQFHYAFWSLEQLGILDVPDDACQNQCNEAAKEFKASYSRAAQSHLNFDRLRENERDRLYAVHVNPEAEDLFRQELDRSPALADALMAARYRSDPFQRRANAVRGFLYRWLESRVGAL